MLSLYEQLSHAQHPRVLVVGDLILDRYVEGEARRVSPEAPVLVFESSFASYRLGGACNVAANVVSVGGSAVCLGLVGNDEGADRLAKRLVEAKIGVDGLVHDEQRLTTVKTRYVSRTHQVLRVDEETKQRASAEAQAKIFAFLDERLGDFDAMILSDYGKGVLDEACLRRAIDRGRERGIPVLVDPKGNDYRKYRGATLVTPNRLEAEVASGVSIDGEAALERVAKGLAESCGLDSVVITLGPDGIYFRTKEGETGIFPTEARAVYDVTGAGDTVVAILAFALAAGFELPSALRLANHAAGIVVGRFGTAAVTRDELLAALGGHETGKVLDDASLAKLLVELRSEKRRVVFTNGCFDLLHPGHLDYLEKARAYGDVLIVGVNDDASIRRQGKGDDRPINPLADRLALLAGLEVVDYLVPFGSDTPESLIERITPHILVKGEDWRDKGVVGASWVESHGGQVVLVPLLQGYSTTALLERIRKSMAR
ncbi:MAG TPA: D-glycero-beta-D-manno-heptose-7-phosphate kinase [Planctomycetota bacterium]|nr:D-glycero-beta-D-manno-heptose-7-phosphate kinase [Planctomycetota bacterium]